MLPENETPEMLNEEVQQEATPASDPSEPETVMEVPESVLSEETAKPAEPETPAEEPEAPADEASAGEPEAPADEAAAEMPDEDGLVPAAELFAEPAEEPVPETAAEAQEAEEIQEADSPVAEIVVEEGVAHISVAPEPAPEVELEPLNEELPGMIDDILARQDSAQAIIPAASVSDLIQLLEQYTAAESVLPLSQRVGLLKRTFDALDGQGGVEEAYKARFLHALHAFNRKRSEQQKEADVLRRENSVRKRELLDTLKQVVEAKDPTRIQEIRDVQAKWKSIGQVLKEDMEPLYSQYRALLDDFYNQRSMYFEMVEYDRKHNLQEKERLIQDVLKLIPEEELRGDADIWRERTDLLNEMQQEWRSIGHVPREEMERVNNEYRAAVDSFFEVRRSFMELQDQQRQENGAKKQAIIEMMEVFAAFEAEKPKDWNDATVELRKLQEAWKGIGNAPQGVNSELWHKYREICNGFFSRKSKFFEDFDEVRAENLAKKRAICERAEQLSTSEEWDKATQELKRLQNDWRAVGPVPERHSNRLWTRFRTACDTFFERRRTHYRDVHSEEDTNLAAKRALIEEVREIAASANPTAEASVQRVRDIQARWKEIGKVPFKEKESIWEEFKGEVDAYFKSLRGRREGGRDSYREGGRDRGDRDGGRREREPRREREHTHQQEDEHAGHPIKVSIAQTRRRIQELQAEIEQYESNLMMIAKGKSGDALRQQILPRIEKNKQLIAEHKDQLKKLNEQWKQAEAEAAAALASAETQAAAEPEAEAEA
ncbi:MAG: DUF349 domain-containing protein [Bacteroidia bacterium]|nr:DUF349 domain-containing protein [Bacteroidia bacterium]